MHLELGCPAGDTALQHVVHTCRQPLVMQHQIHKAGAGNAGGLDGWRFLQRCLDCLTHSSRVLRRTLLLDSKQSYQQMMLTGQTKGISWQNYAGVPATG